jgi:hypothetical protein
MSDEAEQTLTGRWTVKGVFGALNMLDTLAIGGCVVEEDTLKRLKGVSQHALCIVRKLLGNRLKVNGVELNESHWQEFVK